VSFFVRHTNITGGVAFHTWAGVLLRPFDHLPTSEMNAEDLWHYRRTGDKGTELTGYPAISVYEEFRYHPKQVIGGVFDWVYDHLGMYSWVSSSGARCAKRASRTTSTSTGSATTRSATTSSSIAGTSTRSAASRTLRGSRSIIRSSAASRSAAGTAFTRSAIRRRLLEREVERFPKWLSGRR
jgi:hypothetical protein